MLFELMEVKQLGRGMGRTLSLRLEEAPIKLEPEGECGTGVSSNEERSRYTIHAVVPYNTEFGRLQMGATFLLTQIPCPLFQPARLVKDDKGQTIKFELLPEPQPTKEGCGIRNTSVGVSGLLKKSSPRKSCTDQACGLMQQCPHEFGPGCRLWIEGRANA